MRSLPITVSRFFYENGGWPSSFTLEQLQEIRKMTMSRLLCDNTDHVETVQVHAFVLPDKKVVDMIKDNIENIFVVFPDQPQGALQVWEDPQARPQQVEGQPAQLLQTRWWRHFLLWICVNIIISNYLS